ncbi:MAG: hypothetical protein WBP29_10675, partial [Candidatus Zixiibacteriota bacterium]
DYYFVGSTLVERRATGATLFSSEGTVEKMLYGCQIFNPDIADSGLSHSRARGNPARFIFDSEFNSLEG